MPRKKKSCKGESKEKKFMHKEGPIVTFRKSEFQKSTILPGTI